MSANVILKKGEGRTLKAGGAWIYDNEIDKIEGEFENGDMVFVSDFDGYPMGQGFINTRSKITVRMMTRKKDTVVDDAFIEMRVRDAWEYRKTTVDTSSCRLIFGEADFLPGLVVDKYENVLVVQCLALGMEQMKETIVRLLKEVMAEDGIQITGVYERSDAKERKKEGMQQVKAFIGPEFDTNVEITENGVKYLVDVKDGQKTGFFLDQKFNRRVIRNVSKDAEVLECCTHIGSFALNAIKGGAKHVTAMDVSESALNSAKRNAELNGMQDKVDFVCADIFELLPDYINKHKKYDAVFIDPPAFTKSRKTFQNAKNGYTKINAQAMRLVKKGGYFATSSCSHFMPMTEFKKMLLDAAIEANVNIRIIEERHAAYDHPVLLAVPETDYLKFILIQVI